MVSRIVVKTTLLSGLVTLLLAGSAVAAPTEVVANNHDSGAGSLRQAISDVDPGGTIEIPAGVGEITLTSGELKIEKSLTIEGAGSTVIDAQKKSRVLRLAGSPSVEVTGVQIIEGEVASEGAISGQTGAGILVEGGSLTLADSSVVGNTVNTTVSGHSGIGEGGGIAATGATTSLTLRDTVVSDNRVITGVSGDSYGGGIYATGTLTIEGGSVKGNTVQGAALKGGGIYYPSGPRATLSDLTVSGNTGESEPGKSDDIEGAGIYLVGGSGDALSDLTIAKNLGDADDSAASFALAKGGGIEIGAAGTVVINTTVAENLVSTDVKEDGFALGGGMAVAAPATIVNSTVADNTSRGSGTALTSAGGDLWALAKVEIESSILAEGTVAGGGQNCAIEPGGEIVSLGHNIDSLIQCGFHAAGDQSNIEPKLGPLAENGGPVETMALQPGSPAIDAGGTAGCPATDARGVLRPAGAACDVGAFEVATPSATTEAASGVGGGATLSGVATNPDLAGGVVSFQYGTTTAYGSQTAVQTIGATTRGAHFAATVAGLAAGTTYHFQIVVTNAAGTAVGRDLTFTTPAAPPGGSNPNGVTPRPQLSVRHLGGLRFRVHCAGAACQGKLVATARSGRRTVVVAKAKLKLAVGATEKVTLKSTGSGKRLIALPGKLPVVVKAALGGAEPEVPKPLRLSLR